MATLSVLYVDDEPALLELGRAFLETTGEFAIDTRLSAWEGLESLRLKPYDAVISDYQMPDMDGLAFLKAVRTGFGSLPFILFTGRGREEVVIEAINHGVDFYIQKGGDVRAQFAELAHKITMAVERKRAMEEQAASEKQFSAIFHASPIHQMVTEFDTDRIIDINDRFLRDLKKSREEVIGKTTDEIGLMPDAVRMAALKAELAAGGVVRNATVVVRSSSGSVYTTLASMTRLNVHGRDLLYTQSVDITPQKKAQQTIDALLNAPPDPSILFEPDGKILAANNAAAARYGIPLPGLIGKDTFTHISPAFAGLPRAKVAEVLATGKPLVYIDDRSGRAYENHLFPVTGQDGEVRAIAVYSHDITEERMAKDALRESEEKYRLVVEHSHDTIYLHRDNRFLFINRQAEELTGYSHEDLMQREIWDFIHPDDRERLKLQSLQRFAGGAISSSFEARIQKKDGTILDGIFFVDLVEYQGRTAILGIARDVTENKRAEEVIREREDQLRSLSDNLPHGMVYQLIMKPGGERVFVHISAGVEELHGVTADDVLRNPGLLYAQILEEDRAGLNEAEGRALAGMIPFTHEARFRSPSGTVRWMLLRSAPRTLPDGTVIWDGIELDITEARKVKDELNAVNEQLIASQKELHGQIETLRAGQVLLEESEEKYRTLVEQTGEGVFVAQAGMLVFVNRTLADALGYSTGDVTGRPFDHLIAPEDRDLVASRHVSRLAGAVFTDQYEISLLHKDMRRLRFRLRVGAGTFQGEPAVFGTLHDITDERRREARLAESEARFRELTGQSQDMIAVYDRGLRHVDVNPMTEKLSGISRDTFLGKTHAELGFPPDLVRVWEEALNRVFATGKPDRIEFWTPSSGLWVDWVLVPVAAPDGIVTEVIASARDITERKRSEEDLARSEELYRRLITSTFDAVAVYQDGRIVLANDAAAQIVGYNSGRELEGKPIISFIHPDYREKIVKRQQQMLMSSDDIVPLIDEKFIRADGTAIDVEVMASVTQYEGKTAIQVIFRDITQRRQAEEALLESEEKYRHIIEDMQDVFYRTDKDDIFTIISNYGVRLAGFDRAEDIVGKVKSADFYADPNEREAFYRRLMQEKKVSGFRLTIIDRNGRKISVMASGHVLTDAAGHFAGVEGVLHDVTHLLEVEDALRQANRQLTLMTSITRHDIKNQLVALNGWLELSRTSVHDPSRMLDFLSREQKIANVIAEQIQFTTFFDNMGVKPPIWQEPAGLVEKCRASLVSGNVQLLNDLPRITVFADPLLEKVFYNLIDNSLRYGGDRMSRISVSCHATASGLVMVVEDDGIGIPEEDKTRIFRRGYGMNTGLGLFLVAEILAITGISIRETGTSGCGARFEITVPSEKYRDPAG